MSDFIPDPDYLKIKAGLKNQTRKFLIRISILICVNILLFTFFMEDGTSSYARFIISLQAFTSVAVIGFLLGSIVAMFPYKELGYRRKYLRSSLLSISTIQMISLVAMIIAIVLGWMTSFRNNDHNNSHKESLKKLAIVGTKMDSKADSILAVYKKLILLKKESKLTNFEFRKLKARVSLFYIEVNDLLEQVNTDFQGKISPEEYNDFVKRNDDKWKVLRAKKKELKQLDIDFSF